MSAADLAAVTGLPESEAGMYLEMAGGDLEAAVSLYFSMAGDGGMDDASAGWPPAPPSSSSSSSSSLTPALACLFGTSHTSPNSLPVSWTDQPLSFTDPDFPLGIAQKKNGPCGILAAFNAIFLARPSSPYTDSTTPSPSAATVFAVVREVLHKCREDESSPALLVKFGDTGGDDLSYTTSPFPALDDGSLASDLARPLGLLQLLLSMIETRTPSLTSSDATLPGFPFAGLVFGPFDLCGTELVNMVLFGRAWPSVSAYDSTNEKKVRGGNDLRVCVFEAYLACCLLTSSGEQSRCSAGLARRAIFFGWARRGVIWLDLVALSVLSLRLRFV